MAEKSELKYEIVQAFSSHLDLIAPLFDAYRVFYEKESDVGLARSFLRARITHQDSFVYVALEENEEETRALGFALLYPSFNSVTASPIWILNDIYVDDSVRKRGIAKALIEKGIELARETGAKQLSLSTAHTNVPSHKLYESMGFKHDDLFRTYLLNL